MEIKKGDSIMIDRGYKTFFGTFESILGWSAFGFWGEWKDIEGEIHLFDQACDTIKYLRK